MDPYALPVFDSIPKPEHASLRDSVEVITLVALRRLLTEQEPSDEHAWRKSGKLARLRR